MTWSKHAMYSLVHDTRMSVPVGFITWCFPNMHLSALAVRSTYLRFAMSQESKAQGLDCEALY